MKVLFIAALIFYCNLAQSQTIIQRDAEIEICKRNFTRFAAIIY